MKLSNITQLLEEATFAFEKVRNTIGDHNNKILDDQLITIDLALNSVLAHFIDFDLMNSTLSGDTDEKLENLHALRELTSFGRRCIKIDPADRD